MRACIIRMDDKGVSVFNWKAAMIAGWIGF